MKRYLASLARLMPPSEFANTEVDLYNLPMDILLLGYKAKKRTKPKPAIVIAPPKPAPVPIVLAPPPVILPPPKPIVLNVGNDRRDELSFITYNISDSDGKLMNPSDYTGITDNGT